MDEEIWKDIEGYEGYQVSSEGRVRSLDRWTRTKGNLMRLYKGRMLKQTRLRNGYLQVGLCKNGKQTMLYVHRIVAKTFLPNPNNLPCINHKDEKPQNNRAKNLEWCTQEYNINYGTRTERASVKNTNNPKLLKKIYQYTLDGKLVKIWNSVTECLRNGFNNVSNCCRGKYKQHKGFRWSYTPLEAS